MPKVISGRQLLDSLQAVSSGNDPKSTEAGMVKGTIMPKLIHQSWKSTDIPGLYNTLRTTWLDTYPNWTHVLWTDEDNAALVEELYPEHLQLYKGFEAEIFRADMARNMYMHTFGGIYVDLDYDSFKSLDPLLEDLLRDNKQALILGRMAPPVPHNDACEKSSIPNAFMASTPDHPFWHSVLQHVQQAWEMNEVTSDGRPARARVEYMTGPVVLHRAYYNWLSMAGEPPIILLEPKLMYPFSWYATEAYSEEDKHETLDHGGKDFDLEEARRIFNDGTAYACTYWGSSWKAKGWSPERPRR